MGCYGILHRIYMFRMDEYIVEGHTGAYLYNGDCPLMGNHRIVTIYRDIFCRTTCSANIVGNRRSGVHRNPILSILFLQERRISISDGNLLERCSARNFLCKFSRMGNCKIGRAFPDCPMATFISRRGISQRSGGAFRVASYS